MESKIEKWDKAYRDGYRYMPPNKLVLDHIFSKIKHSKLLAKNVLDIGCGVGELASYLSDQDLEVTGLDLSSSAIAEAKKLVPQAHFEAIDFMQWKPSQKFDVVTVKLVYAFMPDKQEFLSRIIEILNKDGILIIDTLTWGSVEPEAGTKLANIGVNYSQLRDKCEKFFAQVFDVSFSVVERFYPGASVTLVSTNSNKLTAFSVLELFDNN